jgi:signal transduction histidine kinase
MEDVQHSGEHLLRLIEDVLDLSRIEAGQTELRREAVDVGALMHACEAIVRGLAESKSVRLEVQPPQEPLTLDVDERRFAQVACNLLSNSLKFTPHGGRVVFRAEHRNGEVVFSVQDQGPGIASQHRERIFEQFYRVPSDQEGTGLGLALAKQLVELHGGRIWLDDAQTGGCCFSFSLPLHEERA